MKDEDKLIQSLKECDKLIKSLKDSTEHCNKLLNANTRLQHEIIDLQEENANLKSYIQKKLKK